MELVWEPWHVSQDHHIEAPEPSSHESTEGFHSHAGGRDENEDREHEHHSIAEHEQDLHPGRIQAPPFAVDAVEVIAIVPVIALDFCLRPPEVPSLAVNESPPDRRFSQRGPPRA